MAVTAYKTPQTCASVDRDAREYWGNPDNAKASDNNYAMSVILKNAYSDWLRATNFGFTTTDIPSGATIDGIEVKTEHKGEVVNSLYDSALYLRKTSGQVGDNKASASKWATSDEEITYGGAADTWNAGLVDTDIVGNTNFGIDLSAANSDRDNSYIAYVDCISIRVYYTVPPTAEYQAASNISPTIARINGKISDDGGDDCEARFRYAKVIQRDDFEWGEDGDDIDDSGGDITWSKTAAGTSTAKISTDQKVSGTRSLELYRDGTNTPYVYFSQTAGEDYIISFMALQSNDGSAVYMIHGNGDSKRIRLYAGYTDQTIRYVNSAGALINTTVSVPLDTWYRIDVKNIDWTSGTYDVYLEDDFVVSATMHPSSGAVNQIMFQNTLGTSAIWLDDVEVIEDWTVTEWQNSLVTDSEYYEDLTELESGTEYEFQTQAQNGAGEGEWSASEYFKTSILRSGIALLGLTTTASRAVVLSRSDTALLGLKTTATKSIALTRSETALLGLLASGSRTIEISRDAVAYLGLKTTKSKAIALVRSSTVLLGLKALGTMTSEYLEHYYRTGVAYLGLVTTATRSIALSRSKTAILELKGLGIRSIKLARLDIALLGLKITATKARGYVRTNTVLLGLEATATRAITFDRAGIALLGLKVTAIRTISIIRSGVALLGLKATGFWGGVGSKLVIKVVTLQYRAIKVVTSQHRFITVITSQYRKIRTLLLGE